MQHFNSVTFDDDADVLYVELLDAPVDHSRSLDDIRVIDYSADGAVIGVEFINATSGVDLSDLPFAETIGRLIGETGLPISTFA
jgi:uncharacterized protein YuzE